MDKNLAEQLWKAILRYDTYINSTHNKVSIGFVIEVGVLSLCLRNDQPSTQGLLIAYLLILSVSIIAFAYSAYKAWTVVTPHMPKGVQASAIYFQYVAEKYNKQRELGGSSSENAEEYRKWLQSDKYNPELDIIEQSRQLAIVLNSKMIKTRTFFKAVAVCVSLVLIAMTISVADDTWQKCRKSTTHSETTTQNRLKSNNALKTSSP